MKLLAKITFGFLIVSIAFFCGYWFRTYSLLNSSQVMTTQPLQLSAENSDGILPSGTVLYHYRSMGEQAIFIAFVGTKRLDAMQPAKIGHQDWFGVVAPIDAY